MDVTCNVLVRTIQSMGSHPVKGYGSSSSSSEKVRGNGYSQEKKTVLGADQMEKIESSACESQVTKSQETKACSENDPTQPTER